MSMSNIDRSKIDLMHRVKIIDEGIDYATKARCSNCKGLLNHDEQLLYADFCSKAECRKAFFQSYRRMLEESERKRKFHIEFIFSQ